MDRDRFVCFDVRPAHIEIIEHFPHRRAPRRPWRPARPTPEPVFEVRRPNGERDGLAEFTALLLVQRELRREPRAGVTEIATRTRLERRVVKSALEYLLGVGG